MQLVVRLVGWLVGGCASSSSAVVGAPGSISRPSGRAQNTPSILAQRQRRVLIRPITGDSRRESCICSLTDVVRILTLLRKFVLAQDFWPRAGSAGLPAAPPCKASSYSGGASLLL